MSKRKRRKEFNKWILKYARKHHPAALLLKNPDVYFGLSKHHRGKLNSLARQIDACIFDKDRAAAFIKFHNCIDEAIMSEIFPTDGWIGNVSTGEFPMGTPIKISPDRFKNVYPDLNKTWTPDNSAQIGKPCDPH